jgi:hypothetical protein
MVFRKGNESGGNGIQPAVNFEAFLEGDDRFLMSSLAPQVLLIEPSTQPRNQD